MSENLIVDSVDNYVITYGGFALVVGDRTPHLSIEMPPGFDPVSTGCGKRGCVWEQVSSLPNVWTCYYNRGNWRNLFYSNRASGVGDFLVSDGSFRCLGYGDTDLVYQMDGLFRGCSGLISTVTIDTRNCYNLSAMFSECSSLVDVPYLDTRNNLDFNNFCNACTNLRRVNERIDTHNGKSFWQMFKDCTALLSVPVIYLDNASETYMSENSPNPGNFWIFKGTCPSLTHVSLRGGSQLSYFGSPDAKNTAVFTDFVARDCELDWDCYLPLFTTSSVGVGSHDSPIVFKDTTVKSLPRGIHMPNWDGGLGNSLVPNVEETIGDLLFEKSREDHFSLTRNQCKHYGKLNLGSRLSLSRLFYRNTDVVTLPKLILRENSYYAAEMIFDGCRNAKYGILEAYNDLLSHNATNHYRAFSNCGIDTVEGSAALAQIPSGWK